MTDKSRSGNAWDIVRALINESGNIADARVDELDPDSRTLVSALARLPTRGNGNTEPQHNARAYLQARAHVQSNVEHAQAMEHLANRLDAARNTGRVLVWVGIGLGTIEVLVTIIGGF